MTDRPVRRVLIVAGIYIPVAALVLIGSDWVRGLLALPELFEDLIRVGLVAGLPVAGLLAWKYPSLGQEGEAAESVRGDSHPVE